MKYGRVLLADGHAHMLEGIRGLLDEMFKVVVMVTDANSFLEVTEKVRPDLVLIDLSLGPGEGMNLVSRFRSLFPEARCIVLSLSDERIIAERVIAAGASGFVLKRSAANDLIPAVEEVLKGNCYVSPGVCMSEPQE